MRSSAEDIQKEYYSRTASQYDSMHTSCEHDEHYVALEFIHLLGRKTGIESLLDVGAGTGRAVRFLLERGGNVRGVEPVAALISQAEQHGIPRGVIVEGSGYSLPFPDKSFDAVLQCGVLHHVAEPARVVREMMRVASKAVFLSDSNRFGQGHPAARLLKLLLYKTHLWNAARFVQTKGNMYTISEGDGLAYSYSVYDSYVQLAEWADSIWLIPLSDNKNRRLAQSWLHPLLTSPHVLLCALRA